MVRHSQRRLAIVLPLLALLLALQATPAAAVRSWCRTDPVLKINGQVVDIWVSSSVEMRSAATGPTEIVVTVPSGVSARLLAMDRGFGWGYAFSVDTSGALEETRTSLQIQVAVRVPSSDPSLPVKVDLTARSPGRVSGGTAEGPANEWVVLLSG